VFSGIAMFGFFGIVLGPVLMIMIVTTIAVYLAVYKGVDMEQHPEEPPEQRRGLIARAARRVRATPSPAAGGPAVPVSPTAP